LLVVDGKNGMAGARAPDQAEKEFCSRSRPATIWSLGLRTISDAVGPAQQWRRAFGYEFLNRADGKLRRLLAAA
jgi:hypothetical protein